MRIYRMIATFGKLEQAELVLEPGLNIIEAHNEWGKSTWCAFLLAMFYGLDTRAKSTKTALADKERYAPWSGSPMSGRVDLCWQGRDITLERRTRGRIPMGEFRAYETATGLHVPELTAHNCGEILLGVEQSVFRRAGFLRLTDLPVTQDEALRRRLNNLVTTGDESGEADRLAGELKELRNRIRYNRTGLLPQAEEEQKKLEQKLAELENLEEQCRKLNCRLEETAETLDTLENHKKALAYERSRAAAARLDRAREDRDRLEKRLRTLEAECARLPGKEETEEKLRRFHALLAQWQSAELEAGLQSLPPEPPEAPEVFRDMTGTQALEMAQRDGVLYETCRPSGIFWLPGVLILAAAAALAFVTDWVIALAAGLVGLVILGSGIHKNLGRQKKRRALAEKYGAEDPGFWQTLAQQYDEAQRDYQRSRLAYRQSRGDLDFRLTKLRLQREGLCGSQTPEKVMEIWQQVLLRHEERERTAREFHQAQGLYQTLLEAVEILLPPERADELDWSEADTERMLSDAREEQRRLSSRLGQLQGRMESLGDARGLARDRDRTEKRIRELEETYDALTLGLNTLDQARRELQRRFAPRIAGRAGQILSRMTGGRYDRLVFGEDFSLLAAAREETTLQSALWRSDGTVDQLYLALRLAVAEELTPRAPLVLDDALVRFDDVRLKAAVEILKTLAKEKQVILFTCQGREKRI